MRILQTALVCLLGTQLLSQSPPGTAAQEQAPQTIRTTVNVVVAPTVVKDSRGEYVSSLKPQEFRLYDNEKLQDIRVDLAFNPISLVVGVQSSSNAEGALKPVKKLGVAFEHFITGTDGEVAIVSFDHRIQVLQDFTKDSTAVTKALEKLKPGSSHHAMTDMVTYGVRMLSKRPDDHRRVLLLIAESRDRGSEGSTREALEYAQLHNVIIYTINMSRFMNAMTREPDYPRPPAVPPEARAPLPGGHVSTPTTVAQSTGTPGYAMDFAPVIKEIFTQVKSIFIDNHAEVFTKYTGGSEYNFTSQRELEKAVSQLGQQLHAQYLITYNPNNKLEGGWHEIRVVVERPNLQVSTRRGYWMAGVPY